MRKALSDRSAPSFTPGARESPGADRACRYNEPDHIPMPLPMHVQARSRAGLALTLAIAAALAGCNSIDGAAHRVANVITPYKVEVVQGNFVSQEQAAALQPGMTREQVRMILGTPLVSSLFHADRWDYVFTIRRKGITQEPKHLAVFFKNGVFERSEGDALPSEEVFVKNIDTQRKLGKIPPLEANAAQLAKAEKNAQISAAQRDDDDLLPVRAYPPLERP